jgi:hypothetical protein
MKLPRFAQKNARTHQTTHILLENNLAIFSILITEELGKYVSES